MLKIFSGRSNERLAQDIARYLSDPSSARRLETGFEGLGRLYEKRGFSDGELYVGYAENIRGCDVFIIQSTNQPHENIQELEMMIDTARGASASRITAVIPYFGYARQDRKDKSRAPVTAITQVKKLKAVGADRILILDAHSSAVENAAHALGMNCDHLWAKPAFVEYFRNDGNFTEFSREGFVVAGPDLNAGKFARGYAEALGSKHPIALIEKRRDPSSGDTEILNVVGNVKDKNVLITDDLIGSGRTIADAANLFKERGALRIFTLATHGVFQGEKGEVSHELVISPIERIFVTDSIYRDNYPMGTDIDVVTVADLLGEAIYRIHTNKSISSLFV